MSAPVGLGIVGAGMISRSYAKHLAKQPSVRLAAVADADPARASALAREVPGLRAVPVEELHHDPEVAVVLVLTPPAHHADVALAAIAAGKHVYTEKPLGVDRTEAAALLDAAAAGGVRVGSAPDTFLSPAFQLAKRLVDEGRIGTPVGVTALTLSPGPEWWHPDPAFFYRSGSGPLFDMGPYQLSALVCLLGPIAAVSAAAATTWPTRTVTSDPLAGSVVEVETLTHLSAVLEFAGGAVGTLTTSFDTAADVSSLDVHGTEATLRCPDPSSYDGPVLLQRRGSQEWTEVELPEPAGPPVRRGAGVVDLVRALREGGQHRASGELALHVVDVLDAVLTSAGEGRRVRPEGLRTPV
ncbi:Gfo/Idh/MocA family oxidoreductase [Lentzea sp. NPDC042327]|uniref:Gfo/Idh/MocA family protein n=1 Tax=Lentzea sp. NPDC042327 TaxID=3154801 RepID=UPI0033CC5BD6